MGEEQHGEPRNTLEERLDSHILSYLLHRGLVETARILVEEGNVTEAPGSRDPGFNFLYEWWAVFWTVFSARQRPLHQGGSTALAPDSRDTDAALHYLRAHRARRAEEEGQAEQALQLRAAEPQVHLRATPELDALLQQAHEVAAALRMVAAQPLSHRAQGNRTPGAFGSRSLPRALQASLPAGLATETAWHEIDAALGAFERVDSAPGPLESLDLLARFPAPAPHNEQPSVAEAAGLPLLFPLPQLQAEVQLREQRPPSWRELALRVAEGSESSLLRPLTMPESALQDRLHTPYMLNPGYPGAQQARQQSYQKLQLRPPPNPFLAARHPARGSGTLAQPVISQASPGSWPHRQPGKASEHINTAAARDTAPLLQYTEILAVAQGASGRRKSPTPSEEPSEQRDLKRRRST